MAKKEFKIQKALGLVSWYSIMSIGGHYQNVQAVSKEDALQRFKWIILIELTEAEAEIILRNSFSVRKLPWAVK